LAEQQNRPVSVTKGVLDATVDSGHIAPNAVSYDGEH